MLKEVLHFVQMYSPTLSNLIAQVWDIESMNVLMLLKLGQRHVETSHEKLNEAHLANTLLEVSNLLILPF